MWLTPHIVAGGCTNGNSKRRLININFTINSVGGTTAGWTTRAALLLSSAASSGARRPGGAGVGAVQDARSGWLASMVALFGLLLAAEEVGRLFP